MSEAKDEEAELVAQVDNTRGIPTAKFIEDIPAFIAKSGIEPEEVLKDMQQIYGKYKFMESQLVSQKKALVTKVPDIGNALKALEYLMSKMESGDALDTKFEVSDAIYASAEIKPQNKVMLWLGANVMLEYNYEDAHKLLSTNLRNAKINLKGLNKDLEFLKDQITISEVNIARVHNHKVQLKQEQEKAVMREINAKKKAQIAAN